MAFVAGLFFGWITECWYGQYALVFKRDDKYEIDKTQIINTCKDMHLMGLARVYQFWFFELGVSQYALQNIIEFCEYVFLIIWLVSLNMASVNLSHIFHNFNSLWPSDAIRRKWPGPSLVQVMAGLFGAKSFAKPIPPCCWLEHLERTSAILIQNAINCW